MSRGKPYIVARAKVERVQRLSPSFMRFTFAGADLDAAGTPGHTFDQRVKLIFPTSQEPLPDIGNDDWYGNWLALPVERRGEMRTYSLRDVQVGEAGTRFIIDIVHHEEHSGPGATWARTAQVGHEVVIIAPRRGEFDGGIEFDPSARDVLLAGDETALPALARILEDADRTLTGIAFIEVPTAADKQSIAAPPGVAVHWLAREDHEHGRRLVHTVLAHLRLAGGLHADSEELPWETPNYSARGEELKDTGAQGTFYWIAAESAAVSSIRKALVSGLGIDRSRFACMGYWRAPRSS